MASFEEYIDGLLPLQQETIAKAALAGVRWEQVEASDWAWTHVHGARTTMQRLKRTKFSAWLRDDTYLGEFDDIYEAAVVGLSIVERESAHDDQAEPDGAFDLLPENAEPTPEPGKGINFARLSAGKPRP